MSDSLLSDDSVFLYIEEINKVPDLSAEEEKKLSRQATDGDAKAIEKIAEAHMKRVVPLVTDYYKNKPKSDKRDFLDLLQAGNTGLLRAAHKFMPNDEYRFWDYADWWVHHEIEKASG